MVIFLTDHNIVFITAHEPRHIESAEILNERIEVEAAFLHGRLQRSVPVAAVRVGMNDVWRRDMVTLGSVCSCFSSRS